MNYNSRRAYIKNEYYESEELKKIKKLEEENREIKERLNIIENKYEERLKKLEKLLNDMLYYAPDALGYDEAKKDYEEILSTKK